MHKGIFGLARRGKYLIPDWTYKIGTWFILIKYDVYWKEKASHYGFEEIYWQMERSMSRFSTSCSRNLFGCNERDVSLLGSPQRLVGAERLAWYWSTFSAALLPSPLAWPRRAAASPRKATRRSDVMSRRGQRNNLPSSLPFSPDFCPCNRPENEHRRTCSNNLSLKNCSLEKKKQASRA